MPPHALLRMTCLLSFVVATWATAEAGVVRLKKNAEVAGGLIRLGDVAEISEDDEAATIRLAALSIAPAPQSGKSVIIDFETIRARLVAQGISLSQTEFTGSSAVVVTSVGNSDAVRPRNATVADSLQRQLQERLEKTIAVFIQDRSPELGNVGVEANLSPEQIALLANAASARYEISGGETPWTGEQDLSVKFFDRQSKSQQFRVRCRIRPLPQILVSARNLPKGYIVRPEDVARKQLDPSTDKGTGLENPELVVGRETTRTLRAGDAIRPSDIRGVPLVRRGDIVTLFAGSSGVRVRMEAKSQGDGCVGERIKLQSLDGRRELTATVTGYHEAAVVPAGSDEGSASNGVGVRLLNGKK